jgi:hypothetical protein
VSYGAAWWLAAGLAIVGAYLLWRLIVTWPSDLASCLDGLVGNCKDYCRVFNDSVIQEKCFACIRKHCPLAINGLLDTAVLKIVLIAGGLGAYVHAVTSFVTYMGNRNLRWAWIYWIALRVPLGAALALLVHFLFMARLLGPDTTPGAEDAQAVTQESLALAVGLAGLVGLFSRQVIDKLAELMDTLIPSKANAERKDKVGRNAGAPEIERLDPPNVQVGQAVEVQAIGQGFQTGAKVTVNGAPRNTTFVTAKQLLFKLEDDDVAEEIGLSIVVVNPPPDGTESEPAKLPVGTSK